MIPKPLNEIEWSDIEALRDSGREEDDTIEFKGSFSGGSDYLVFNDAKRAKAIEGIAREAVAFLNGRGGDIIIGATEAANDHPKIEEITPVQNVDQTVDRLGQSLAALIEPTQSIVCLRAIRRTKGDSEGVIIIRCPSSLRAPHRFSPTKDCYIRRGRSSVPMPMDEVQDVTLNRAMLRSERNHFMDGQFASFRTGQIGIRRLAPDRAHMRVVFVPNSNSDIELSDHLLQKFAGSDPTISNGQHSYRNEIAFSSIRPHWRHELRGRRIEGFSETGSGFLYSAKSIKSYGMMVTEFSSKYNQDTQSGKIFGQAIEWIEGFLANSLVSMRDVFCLNPQFSGGTIRIAHFCADGWHLLQYKQFFEENLLLQPGVTEFPDFEIEELDSFDEVFRQAQIDFKSLAGLDCPHPYSLPALK